MLAATPQPAVLLIADDDEDTRRLFRVLLTARGHRVLEARDGRECLELAGAHLVDLIALDMRMPRLDGFAVAAALRADLRTAALPILAITALAEAALQRQALRAGCDEVLVKPFSPRVLLDRVEALVEARRRQGPDVQAPGPSRG